MTRDADTLLAVLQGCGQAVAAAVTTLRATGDVLDLAAERGMGADGAPTCRVDEAAEEAALAYLDALPARWHFNILSEECGLIDRGAAVTLVIDPIDATNNAVTDFPYYAFSIAAVDQHPLAGCVLNLPTGDCWTAIRGEGALLNGRRLARRAVTSLDEALLAVVRPASAADLERLQPVLLGARRVRITGCTALDLCLIAGGTLDGFVNPNMYVNPLWGEKVVDYAAAALVLEEMGGVLRDQAGQPLAYPLDMRHRLSLQAAATPALLEVLLTTLKLSSASQPEH